MMQFFLCVVVHFERVTYDNIFYLYVTLFLCNSLTCWTNPPHMHRGFLFGCKSAHVAMLR